MGIFTEQDKAEMAADILTSMVERGEITPSEAGLPVEHKTRVKRGPKPRVVYRGRSYTCRRWKVEVPDLDQMDPTAALMWLNQNTIPTGRGIRTAPTPYLAGYPGLQVR